MVIISSKYSGIKNHKFAKFQHIPLKKQTQYRLKRFLKGPIPLEWLTTASRLHGKAINVSLALWYMKGLTKNDTVSLSGTVLKDFGVSRQAMYRGLKKLELVGLVSVSRHIGRCPKVTILKCEQ